MNPRSHPLIKRMGRDGRQGESWVVYRAILNKACPGCHFPKYNQLSSVLFPAGGRIERLGRPDAGLNEWPWTAPWLCWCGE